METKNLDVIVTRLSQEVYPFIAGYYDAKLLCNVRLLVFGKSVTEAVNITENFLADQSIDGVIVSVEMFGVGATLFGVKPNQVAGSTYDEFDDLIRQ